MKGALSIRPVCKETDRTIVRELFRQECYGTVPLSFPDEGLWEIYDSMETEDAFGAYLIFYYDQPLFLLEVHPPVQMDLAADYLSRPGTVGIYSFYSHRHDPMNLPALRACIDAMLGYPFVQRIVTRLNFASDHDPRVALLEKAGFRRQTKSSDRSAIYYCTADTFSLFTKNTPNRQPENVF